MNNLIYNIYERPAHFSESLIYAFQQVLAVFVATVLIANICGTPISSCLFSAGVATLIYQLLTKAGSPMFISSCGATCTAVIGALALGNGNNYEAVVIGGIIIALIYTIFAFIIYNGGIDKINKLFPPSIVGAITMVIGLNLATFIPTYVQVGGQSSTVGVIIAIITMGIVAISSHYLKGFWKTIPFLIGIIGGYIISLILTLCHIAPLINFELFNHMTLFAIPDFTFKYWQHYVFSIGEFISIICLFGPVAICSLMEHYSDHQVLSRIIGTDLTINPGLHRTLVGDGIASCIGTILCGLPNTSYGESIATTGFSRVASSFIIRIAAIILIILAFINPVQVLIQSIPSCVFGGCAMILYGYIAASGLKTIISSNINLENNKNLIIISVILTVGVSGIFLFSQALTGVSLAIVLGLLLNLILKDK